MKLIKLTEEGGELRGMETIDVPYADVDAYVRMIRGGFTTGTVESLEKVFCSEGRDQQPTDYACDFRRNLPISLRAFDEYRQGLVKRAVLEMGSVRIDGEYQPVAALAKDPELLDALLREAKTKGYAFVRIRVETTPLDLVRGIERMS